jgi:hypothetical protein
MDSINEEKKLAEDKIRKLRSKIAKLEKEVKAKENIVNNVWSKRLSRAIDRYSQAHMSRVAHLVYTKLPRELRDAIYREIIVDDFGTSALPWSLSVLYNFPEVEKSGGRFVPRKHFSEHYLVTPPFVGRDMAIEAAEMFHSLANKTLLGNNLFEKKPTILHLKAFLKADVFGLGIFFFLHLFVSLPIPVLMYPRITCWRAHPPPPSGTPQVDAAPTQPPEV